MSVLLVYNRSAGSGEVTPDELMSMLRSSGIDPEAISSDDDCVAEALMRPRDLVVVAGGDGTVARVATGLADRSVPVAILPTGGSNNIARALQITGGLEDLVAGFESAPVAQLDIGLAEGVWGRSCFVEAAGLGVLTAALGGIEADPQTTEEKVAIGRKALAEAVADAEPAEYRYELDGRAVSEPLLMLEVLNIGGIGPRLPLAAGAQTGDGRFAAVSLSPDNRECFLEWLDTEEGEPPVAVTFARGIRLLAGPEEVRLDDPKRTLRREGQEVRFCKDQPPVRVLVPQVRSGDRKR